MPIDWQTKPLRAQPPRSTQASVPPSSHFISHTDQPRIKHPARAGFAQVSGLQPMGTPVPCLRGYGIAAYTLWGRKNNYLQISLLCSSSCKGKIRPALLNEAGSEFLSFGSSVPFLASHPRCPQWWRSRHCCEPHLPPWASVDGSESPASTGRDSPPGQLLLREAIRATEQPPGYHNTFWRRMRRNEF